MLSTTRLSNSARAAVRTRRHVGTIAAVNHSRTKAMGDISSVFPSLNGAKAQPLPPRFAELKRSLVAGRENAIQDSWRRLLPVLDREIDEIRAKGPSIIPSIDFSALSSPLPAATLAEIKARGSVIIRNVLPPSLALFLKSSSQEYIRSNASSVRAFPAASPAVYELYWSPAQVAARSHPNILRTQSFLQSLWHSSPSTPISTQHPLTYADRLRIRLPGDSGFALGPHVDGGSLERWEDPVYRANYSRILSGQWESHDAYDATHRVRANMDMYNGAGAASMFRMWQGWLSLSNTAPGEGTLRLFPALKEATAYWMLRPFIGEDGRVDPARTGFEGAAMGACQELSSDNHPGLRLQEGMVSIPEVAPGDFVAWHCDAIHAVDKTHAGRADSSVFYIPATPLTPGNVEALRRQKDAALAGEVPPDFPGAGNPAVGEGKFVGKVDWETAGTREMGMGGEGWEVQEDMTEGAREAVWRGNEIMGW
ncbi:DUF1479 domain protein [Tricharina praecox]|uniref:DUF1479 domain protein n=1 Tax=Tricharina praecox TaxID=43433 RepID=UPI00221E91CB|nr:DUF1479 domain protein [Tricharina praecox]KAI5842372.1 DUF1479 domain protein [Tricharina praecox]